MAALGFLRSKWAVAGLSGLVIVTILFLGYRHYTGLLSEVQTLQAETSTLRLGLDTERAAVRDLRGVIGDWELSQAQLLERVEEMQEEANEARAETRRLRQLFAELDFSEMSPAAVDSVADATTDRLWRLIHAATDQRGHGGSGETPGEAPASGTGAGGPGGGGLGGGGDTERPDDRPE